MFYKYALRSYAIRGVIGYGGRDPPCCGSSCQWCYLICVYRKILCVSKSHQIAKLYTGDEDVIYGILE